MMALMKNNSTAQKKEPVTPFIFQKAKKATDR